MTMKILAKLLDACDDPQLVKHYYLVCKQIQLGFFYALHGELRTFRFLK